MKYSLFAGIGLMLLSSFQLLSQNPTLGLLQNEENSFNGYTLFSPANQFNTYLVDNCGEMVHKWEAETRIGASEYLLEDGSLLRTARIQGNFNGGGITGRIEQYNWDGELIWNFDFNSFDYHLHHDIEPLPNGNILMVAWERKDQFEAMQAGRIGDISPSGVWPDFIIEVKPIGTDSAEIVWEWHAWDHMIQDVDPDLSNYGIVADNRHRIDINFESGGSDWIHANAIDYNESLDQIVLSSRHWSEFWIIDHSTTTEEAATSEGGNSGMGGDLLYRWGNAASYNLGGEPTQKLFGQHDVRWIESDYRYGGYIMMFNNGLTESSIGIIAPPLNSEGTYDFEMGMPFGPEEFEYVYDGGSTDPFFSSRISGARMLENGNILICEGRDGRFFEVTESEEKVWDYINPDAGNIFSQGEIAMGNSTFRTTKHGLDYPAFEGRDLDPKGPVENDPIDNGCNIYSSTYDEFLESQLTISPTLISSNFILSNPLNKEVQMYISDPSGNVVGSGSASGYSYTYDASTLTNGMYFVQLVMDDNQIQTIKVVKF